MVADGLELPAWHAELIEADTAAERAVEDALLRPVEKDYHVARWMATGRMTPTGILRLRAAHFLFRHAEKVAELIAGRKLSP